jgi:hypothetical protein
MQHPQALYVGTESRGGVEELSARQSLQLNPSSRGVRTGVPVGNAVPANRFLSDERRQGTGRDSEIKRSGHSAQAPEHLTSKEQGRGGQSTTPPAHKSIALLPWWSCRARKVVDFAALSFEVWNL